MGRILSLTYTSVARSEFGEDELRALLEYSRRRNEASSVTGMLLYVAGSFFQVLEGDPVAVDETAARIALDTRHHKLSVIIREPVSRRSFAEWSMGFTRLHPTEMEGAIGIDEHLRSAIRLQQLGEGRSRKLLQAFVDGRWRARLGQSRHPAVA